MATICPKGAGALFTSALKGGYDACVKFVDSLQLFTHVANLGDTRSLVIHPASTTHRQLSPEQLDAADATTAGTEDAGLQPQLRNRSDRKSVGSGKSGSVRVDTGGSRILKKKKT